MAKTKREKIKDVWDFVEKYYPGYSTCGNISEEDDLQKIIDNDCEEGDDADNLRNAFIQIYGLDNYLDHVRIAQTSLQRDIFQEAIKGYIEQQ